MNPIYDELKDKNILILGFGKEGKSTYSFIRKRFKDMVIGIADEKPDVNKEELTKDDKNIKYHLGGEYKDSINEYDIVIKSPGVTLNNMSYNAKITSQTELFLKHYSKNVIGVTATKGKTTTVTLLAHIFKKAKRDVVLVGNVGIPVFDKVDEISDNTIVVYELSSYQLEQIHNSPHISIIINMYEDHLSTHGTMENYKKAKFNIVKYQDKQDIFIYNYDNEIVKEFAEDNQAKGIKYSVSQKTKEKIDTYLEDDWVVHNNERIYNINETRNIIGNHNLYNIMMDITAAKLLGVANKDICEAIASYVPEPHRLEYVGTFNGIKYYNDSIATVPAPTMEGIKALKEIDTLIVGGYDKGVDYEPISKFLIESDIRNILCVADTGKKMYNMMIKDNNSHNIIYFETLKEATEEAKKITAKGKICLMSPAAASFGEFNNFEERGDKFKEWVRN